MKKMEYSKEEKMMENIIMEENERIMKAEQKRCAFLIIIKYF
jgi:hypothetical protein